jgi:hypothetical protein
MSTHNYQRARRVLQALVQGVDPKNGSELPADAVLNRVDVVRALLAAVEALDVTAARALRRAQLPKSVGKPWSEDEVRQLKEEFTRGDSVQLIAANHGRTVRAIESRLEILGLLRADQRATSDPSSGARGAKEDQ